MRVGEKERERFPRDLPTTAHRHRCVPFFVRSLKVVEGLTRKATSVEIYLAGMLLLAGPLRDEEIEASTSFSLFFFFLIGWIGYRGFIRDSGIKAWRYAFVPSAIYTILKIVYNISVNLIVFKIFQNDDF